MRTIFLNNNLTILEAIYVIYKIGNTEKCFMLHKKMKFPIKDFCKKCDQIHMFLRICFLKKFLEGNLIFCEVLPFNRMYYLNKILRTKWSIFDAKHCLKCIRIRSYSGPYFVAFSLNTRIKSEFGKMRTRITPNADAVHAMKYSNLTHPLIRNKKCAFGKSQRF